MIKAFDIDVPQSKIDSILERVRAFRGHPAPVDDDWQYGMKTSVLTEIVDYWGAGYDWRAQEKELNRYDHFMASVEDLDVHFVHVVGEAKGQRPLLLTHGWPGSVYEFWESIDRLAFPSRFGGSADDAFDLIIPSLPGYGWSGKPDKPIGQKTTARLWDTLMTDVLGYDSYLAQGGDWGASVSTWLGRNHGPGKGGCRAIHLNMIMLRPNPGDPKTDDERAWLAASQAAMSGGSSYLQQQMTKPQTLAIGLMDSPVGQAAWILEKFHGWSDLKPGGLLETYSKNQLLTNLMIYLVNDAFATSVWYYNGFIAEGAMPLAEGERCETPVGFANFPGDKMYSPPPRSWVERAHNLTHWADMPRGGHFAAMEEPELFADAVRAWGREH